MTPLSIACVILGCYYAGIRFPLAIAPDKTTVFLRVIFGSELSTRLFGIAWLIPWIVAVYSSFQSEVGISKLISIWGIIGTIISLYVIVFASKYSIRMKKQLENITPAIRVFALMTAFLGVFLIYLGIKVF